MKNKKNILLVINAPNLNKFEKIIQMMELRENFSDSHDIYVTISENIPDNEFSYIFNVYGEDVLENLKGESLLIKEHRANPDLKKFSVSLNDEKHIIFEKSSRDDGKSDDSREKMVLAIAIIKSFLKAKNLPEKCSFSIVEVEIILRNYNRRSGVPVHCANTHLPVPASHYGG